MQKIFVSNPILFYTENKKMAHLGEQSPGIYGTVDRRQKHPTDSDKHWKQR